MNKKLILSITLLLTGFVYSQVGINTNNPSATLDLVSKGNTSSTKAMEINNAAAKEMVTILNNGNVGIGQSLPTASLHVKNLVSPAFRLEDGTQGAGKVLTSDTNGNSSWVYPALKAISGNLPTSLVSFSSYGTGNPPNISMYTGGYINLPPGKWLISFGSIASMGQNDRINTTDAQLWCTAFLSDSNAGAGTITADYISAYTGQRGSGGSIGRGMNRTMVIGSIAVNNVNGGNKTYYLWANQELETAPAGPSQININGTSTAGYWINLFGNGNWERYFYAIPIQ
ncbi:hypothetical protein FW781_18985 [Chryseobacterium panacisoli]|uniref:Uncharacterized protein n=1 Tax=Chryseobacterium panacisoli TaxID=1807141 RepID=A0A5D8ZIC8_9FLAO|nr:hypothetical protein [Chryseobacterium panacisoli]TZF93772.1 hypothetical protein FW781_18985 [Chryseobacterium panacisoli]